MEMELVESLAPYLAKAMGDCLDEGSESELVKCLVLNLV